MRFFAGAMNGVKLFASYTDGSFFALFGCVPETALRATATSLEITVKIALSILVTMTKLNTNLFWEITNKFYWNSAYFQNQILFDYLSVFAFFAWIRIRI